MLKHLLAIDIGNTHIKIGLYQDDDWQHEWRMSTDIKRTADEYRLSLRGFLEEAGVGLVDQTVIASVVPLLTPAFTRVAETLSYRAPLEIVPPGYGLEVAYKPPESLGADRFINALAAWHKIQDNVVVVDMGTTATIDAVALPGVFLGGSIAPGPHFLANALAQGTARLPLIPPNIPELLIGQSTQQAIAVGVGHGFVGMVNELVFRTWQMLGRQTPVVLTGGWARRVQPHLKFAAQLEPMLTLEGLRYAAMWADSHSLS